MVNSKTVKRVYIRETYQLGGGEKKVQLVKVMEFPQNNSNFFESLLKDIVLQINLNFSNSQISILKKALLVKHNR